MEKKQILCKRVDPIGLKSFWEEINKAYDEGWRYNQGNLSIQEMPRVSGVVRVVLSRGIADEVTPNKQEPFLSSESEIVISGGGSDIQEIIEQPLIVDEVIEESKEVILEDEVAKSVEGLFEDLDKLTKKKELLEYAESFGIEVSEDIKQPAAIKKHIKEQLSN